MRFRYHAQARAELLKAARFYDDRSRGLGDDFLNEVDRAIESILLTPTSWPVIFGQIRRRVLTSAFPYNIIYSIVDGTLFIIAVAHHSRDEDYWTSRAE